MVLSALPTDPQRTATHVADAAQTSALIPATTTATVIPACVGRHTGDDNNVSTGEGAVNALSPCFFFAVSGNNYEHHQTSSGIYRGAACSVD